MKAILLLDRQSYVNSEMETIEACRQLINRQLFDLAAV